MGALPPESSSDAGQPPAPDLRAAAERIREAAADAFSDLGYGGCSVAQLASRAGVSKNQLFYYYASKEAVAQRALDAGLAELTAIFHSAERAATSLEALGLLRRALSEHLDGGGGSLRLLAALSASPAALPQALQERVEAAQGELTEQLRRLIKGLAREAQTDPRGGQSLIRLDGRKLAGGAETAEQRAAQLHAHKPRARAAAGLSLLLCLGALPAGLQPGRGALLNAFTRLMLGV